MKTEIRYPTRDLDLALRTFRAPDSRIILEPGHTYTTRGAWAFAAYNYIGIAAGVELVAEGCDIVLKDPVIDPLRPWLEFPWLGGSGAAFRSGIWRLEQPDKKNPMALSGFHFVGHCTLEAVSLYGQCGSRGALFKEKEVFSVRQTDTGEAGLTAIHGCKFISVENNGNDCYNSGIYPSMVAVVEHNEVRLSNGQFGLSCVKPANFNNNLVMAARGFYTDYEADCKASLSNNQFETTYAGVSFASKKEDAFPRRRELVSINDAFNCGDGRLVEFFNGGGKQSGYVALVNTKKWDAKYRVATTDPNMKLLLIQSPGNETAVDHIVGGVKPEVYA